MISGDIGSKGTPESAGLIAGDDVGTEQVDRLGSQLFEMELVLERRKGKCCSDEGAVVTNHDGRRSSDSTASVDSPVVDRPGSGTVFDLVEYCEETHCEGLFSDFGGLQSEMVVMNWDGLCRGGGGGAMEHIYLR